MKVDTASILKRVIDYIGSREGYGYTFEDLILFGNFNLDKNSDEYKYLKQLCDEVREEDNREYQRIKTTLSHP